MLAWLGLYLSLNYTTSVKQPAWMAPAVEATAIVGVGKATVTGIVIQPWEKTGPLFSVGVGFRVF